jgi:hypothetical protein
MTHPAYTPASPSTAAAVGSRSGRDADPDSDADPDPDTDRAVDSRPEGAVEFGPAASRVRTRARAGKIALPAVAEATGRSSRARVEPMAVRPLRDGRYVVETDGGTYVVDLERRTCTCPDHAIRTVRCKHLRRVAIEVTAGLVAPPGRRRGVCAVCGRETFVPTGATGPQLCERHRIPPGTAVRDRETGSTLVVVSGPGDRADATRTAEGRPVADYPSNAAYGGHEPVVDCVYLADARVVGDAVDTASARRYSFPASRLRTRRGRPFRFRLVDARDADATNGSGAAGREVGDTQATLTADTAP